MVTILIVTFNRPKEIRKTIYEFLKHQNYPIEKLTFHLADSDTEKRTGTVNYVQSILADFPYLDWQYTIESNPGWGYNVNTALKKISDNYIFLIEDDYVAIRDVDLVSGIELMEKQTNIGAIRYDGIAAHTGMILHLKELKTETSRIDYCLLDKESQHLNVYSNRPHLRHKRFTECYGYYLEGRSLGYTEDAMAHTVKDKKQCCDIAILGNGIEKAFDHIGASYQNGVYDK